MSAPIKKSVTREEAEVINKYASIVKQIKELEAQAKELRPGLDVLVSEYTLDDTIECDTGEYSVTFSKATDSLKLSVPLKQLLIETDNYEVLSVSVTKCKDSFTAAQMSSYFNVVKGSRRISVL